MSTSCLTPSERARNLLTLIESLEIENDLRNSQKNLDEWREKIILSIDETYRAATHRIDSLRVRLGQLKENRGHDLRRNILPNLNKIRKLSGQEQREINENLRQIEENLQIFGLQLAKVGQDEKRLNEILENLQNIQNENLQLKTVDKPSFIQRSFKLETGYSPFISISQDGHFLIEDENHIVLYNNERRIHEIPWQQGEKNNFTGAIKDLNFSNSLNQFCVLSSMNFFTFDIESLALEKSEQIRPSTGSHFQSVACLPNKSEIYLLLLTSGSRATVERWSLVSGSLIRRWYHDVFESDDRFVSTIRANETTLAFGIKQQKIDKTSSNEPNFHWRVDLFDMNLVRLYRTVHLKSAGLGTFVSPFDDRSWLVANGNDIWILDERAQIIESKQIDQREKLLNIIVKRTNQQAQKEFILKFGQPAELRFV